MPYKHKEESLAYHKARYEREKDKLKAQALARYHKNRETRLEQMKHWREEHPEEAHLNSALYHWEHREDQLAKMKVNSASFYQRNRERLLPYYRERNLKKYHEIRQQVLAHYDNRCACCGETNLACLTIDHIAEDGADHRREVGRGDAVIRWLLKNNFPEGFQVLCFNCNCARPKGACHPKSKTEPAAASA